MKLFCRQDRLHLSILPISEILAFTNSVSESYAKPWVPNGWLESTTSPSSHSDALLHILLSTQGAPIFKLRELSFRIRTN